MTSPARPSQVYVVGMWRDHLNAGDGILITVRRGRRNGETLFLLSATNIDWFIKKHNNEAGQAEDMCDFKSYIDN